MKEHAKFLLVTAFSVAASMAVLCESTRSVSRVLAAEEETLRKNGDIARAVSCDQRQAAGAKECPADEARSQERVRQHGKRAVSIYTALSLPALR